MIEAFFILMGVLLWLVGVKKQLSQTAMLSGSFTSLPFSYKVGSYLK